jgi:hypothetical protein
MKKLILIFGFQLLLTSCLKEEVPFQYIFRVHVTNSDNKKIEGAIITLKYLKTGQTDTQYTDSEGYCEFNSIIEAGEYNIWAQKEGIGKDTQNKKLDENKIEPVNLTLK